MESTIPTQKNALLRINPLMIDIGEYDTFIRNHYEDISETE